MSRTNLQTISTPDLLKEIQRREKAAKAIPAAIPEPDFQPLMDMVDKMLTTAVAEEYWDDDNKQYIYEEVMSLMYGDKFFEWRNRQDW